MANLHVKTPLIRSEIFKKIPGEVFIKLETFQNAGSFKIRGIGHLIENAKKKKFSQIVCPSGGNAGIAAAYAARKLGIRATIVVPQTTTQSSKEKILSLGAKLKIHGNNWGQSNDLAKKMTENEQSLYVPPFDHPMIFQGHSSIILESISQMPKPSAIVLSVGGGGLLCGVVAGLRKSSWKNIRIYAVETNGAASLAAALKAKQPVDIGQINTVATTLGAPQVCTQAYLDSVEFSVRSKLVSDEECIKAIKKFANMQHVLVEPSCGAALALLEKDQDIKNEPRILVIACGGNGVSLDLINLWSRQFSI